MNCVLFSTHHFYESFQYLSEHESKPEVKCSELWPDPHSRDEEVIYSLTDTVNTGTKTGMNVLYDLI